MNWVDPYPASSAPVGQRPPAKAPLDHGLEMATFAQALSLAQPFLALEG